MPQYPVEMKHAELFAVIEADDEAAAMDLALNSPESVDWSIDFGWVTAHDVKIAPARR